MTDVDQHANVDPNMDMFGNWHCPTCWRMFQDGPRLYTHIGEDHPPQPVPTGGEWWWCSRHPSQVFREQDEYDAHVAAHVPRRKRQPAVNYGCGCDKDLLFTGPDAFTQCQDHMRTAHNIDVD